MEYIRDKTNRIIDEKSTTNTKETYNTKSTRST